MDINPEIVEKIRKIVINDPKYYAEKTGNDERYNEFIHLFPKTKIKELTLNEYCLGDPEGYPNNFCWWIEHNLSEALGRYAMGSALGHIIYKRKDDGKIQKIKDLEGLSDEDAMDKVAKLHSFIINSDVNDVDILDDNSQIAKLAGLDRSISIGGARKLRLLNAYNPDYFPIVNSPKHIGKILLYLGMNKADMPAEKFAIKRAELLRQYYHLIKKQIGLNISPYHFGKLFYENEDALGFSIKDSIDVDKDENDEIEQNGEGLMKMHSEPLNQIFYGPPGTGKTYRSAEIAVKIADFRWYQEWCDRNNVEGEHRSESESRRELKEKYDELLRDMQIQFVTFHQSFCYEDFIEGIRAITDQESNSLSYIIEDGIFKKIVSLANQKELVTYSDNVLDISDRKFWKISLGKSDEQFIYEECLKNNYILLGYGKDIDFKGLDTQEEIREKYVSKFGNEYEKTSCIASIVHKFKNEMKQGDIVIVSDGNYKFRAIGEVVDECQFQYVEEQGAFYQTRPIEWLRVFETSLPVDYILDNHFSQSPLYRLADSNLKKETFRKLIESSKKGVVSQKNYVLIIDEINRGNIANIFGELITLIEQTKRSGEKEAQSTTLPYSKERFSIPNNLYLIGTMNTSDRSLTSLDIALRRRFKFIELLPKYSLLNNIKVYGVHLSEILKVINQRIEVLLGRDFLIGHSYFLPLKSLSEVDKEQQLASIFKYQIIPLLQEYFYDDWNRIQWVLNDQVQPREYQFVQSVDDRLSNQALNDIFPENLIKNENLIDRRYQINEGAFYESAAYLKILLKK